MQVVVLIDTSQDYLSVYVTQDYLRTLVYSVKHVTNHANNAQEQPLINVLYVTQLVRNSELLELQDLVNFFVIVFQDIMKIHLQRNAFHATIPV